MLSVVISIGSNCGDRKKNVEKSIEWLKTFLMQTKCSEIYETPCALKTGKNYINAVISGFYEGVGYDLEDQLKLKEHEMGRTPECRKRGDVPVDMDIVIENNVVIKDWDYRQQFFQIGFEQIQDKQINN